MKKQMITIFLVFSALLLAACNAAPVETQAVPTAVETEEPEGHVDMENTEPEGTMDGNLFTIIPGESQVSYEVGEIFLNQGNAFATAIGVTGIVKGDVSVDMETPANSTISPIVVDIYSFRSDSGKRDNAIRGRFLMSDAYPRATFVPTSIDGLPESYTEGESINFQVTGDLTVKETTRPVTFAVTVQVSGNSLTGDASTTLLMSDFGVGPISIAGILETEDEVKLNFSIAAKR